MDSDKRAKEESTYGIVAEFTEVDPDGNEVPVVPNDDLRWSLYDPDGQIINGREDIPLVPNLSVLIVLYGADLALSGDYPEDRYLLLEGTYDSSLGENLPIKAETMFRIDNLVGI